MCVSPLLQDSGEKQKERQDLLKDSRQDHPDSSYYVCQRCRSGHQCVALTSPPPHLPPTSSSLSFSPSSPFLPPLLVSCPCSVCSQPLEGVLGVLWVFEEVEGGSERTVRTTTLEPPRCLSRDLTSIYKNITPFQKRPNPYYFNCYYWCYYYYYYYYYCYYCCYNWILSPPSPYLLLFYFTPRLLFKWLMCTVLWRAQTKQKYPWIMSDCCTIKFWWILFVYRRSVTEYEH